MNKIILIGRVGKEIELKTSKAGKAYLQNSLATSDGFGEKKKTNWHNFSVFGKSAEYLAKYGAKGALVYLEGSVDYDEFEKDGVKKYSTKIMVEKCSVLKDGAERAPSSSKENLDDIPF